MLMNYCGMVNMDQEKKINEMIEMIFSEQLIKLRNYLHKERSLYYVLSVILLILLSLSILLNLGTIISTILIGVLLLLNILRLYMLNIDIEDIDDFIMIIFQII